MPEPSYIPLFTAAQVRELDRVAIEEKGVPGYQLMCRAGKALAQRVEQVWPAAKRVCVLCGPGNNGGDGYVLGRLLLESGVQASILFLCEPGRLRGDASRAAQDYLAAGGEAREYTGELPEQVDLLVDAVLGTGLDRPAEGRYLEAIQALNRHGAPVLAVDIPSGLHADTGRVLGEAVQASCTLTFIGRKRGLYTGAGVQYAGEVVFDDLAVPAEVFAVVAAEARLIKRPPLGDLARPRRRDAHKGEFGHVLVVGGDQGMCGAARLAAEAAARCGAGLVSVATRAEHASSLNAGCPELMVHGVEEAAELAFLVSRANAIVIGPGLGRSRWAKHLFERVLESKLPLVVDADALNLLARDPVQRDNWILTPHPGEAGRLLGRSAQAVQQDRFAAVQQLVDGYRGVTLLKGAGTLIAAASEPIRVCARGNPGMASGGMGDVLSGVAGALLAQGLGLFSAASSAACLHAEAADLAALRGGERGMLASDLMPLLRELINGPT